MALQLGDIAPDFTQDSTAGPIHFHEWVGDSWAILFSHPKESTPVSSRELSGIAKLKSEFDQYNAKLIGLSSDGVDNQGTALNFPLISDTNREVSTLYSMTQPTDDNTASGRSVYIIGPDRHVKVALDYPASMERNALEILWVVDSLQSNDDYEQFLRSFAQIKPYENAFEELNYQI